MKRFVFFDWLRILATIGVVVIHIASGTVATNMHDDQLSWLSGNLFESLTRWAVPMFVMISGALLLSDQREYTYKEFLTKRISKVFIPLLGWSIIYYSYFVYVGEYSFSIADFISLFSSNSLSYHFWFVYMILGLYLITPVLKIFIRHAKQQDIGYFLLLWFYASVVAKTLVYLYGYSFAVELYYVTNYVGYYVLGYYLFNYDIAKRWRNFVYIGGIIGFTATFLLTYIGTRNLGGMLQEFWYEYHSPNVMLATIGLFVFFKYLPFKESYKIALLPKLINKTSFGIYLVHILAMRILSIKFLFYWIDIHPILGIPYRAGLTIALSMLIIWIMQKIPFVKKLVP